MRKKCHMSKEGEESPQKREYLVDHIGDGSESVFDHESIRYGPRDIHRGRRRRREEGGGRGSTGRGRVREGEVSR